MNVSLEEIPQIENSTKMLYCFERNMQKKPLRSAFVCAEEMKAKEKNETLSSYDFYVEWSMQQAVFSEKEKTSTVVWKKDKCVVCVPLFASACLSVLVGKKLGGKAFSSWLNKLFG